MSRLKNKIAIITGGTGGLGKEVLSVFLREGAKVFTTYIVRDELEECINLKQEYGERLVYGKADVTKSKDMSKADHAKWVKPEEIAEVISFLYSKDGDSISGAVVPVYGKT